jgi:hypothetical protein
MADMADLNSKCDLMPNDVWIKLSDETKRMYYMEVLEIERVQKMHGHANCFDRLASECIKEIDNGFFSSCKEQSRKKCHHLG